MLIDLLLRFSASLNAVNGGPKRVSSLFPSSSDVSTDTEL
jgi:hypothetical protein